MIESLLLEMVNISINYKTLPFVTTSFMKDGYVFLLLKDFFNHQTSVPNFSEFGNLVHHLTDYFEFQDQLNGDFLVKFVPGVMSLPVALKIQGSQISENDF